MPQNLYEVIWIFIIYAFIGWCTEVTYQAVERGVFINRGFLNGPYCPIYGIGVVIVTSILSPLKGNLIILFFGSFLLTSVLEFITGFVMEKIFHNKWWDYSEVPFNIMGYVCLKFSIFWGMACSFIVRVLHPIIYDFIKIIPHLIGYILAGIIMIAFIADCVVTVMTILKLNKRLKTMDEIAAKMKVISDEIGNSLYENVTNAVEKRDEFVENHEELINNIVETKTMLADKKEQLIDKKDQIWDNVENYKNGITESLEGVKNYKEGISETIENMKNYSAEKRKEYELLTQRYKELSEKKPFGQKRLLQAFPGMKSRRNNESLSKLKIQIKNPMKKTKKIND